jgi:hypothetical protein
MGGPDAGAPQAGPPQVQVKKVKPLTVWEAMEKTLSDGQNNKKTVKSSSNS